MGVAGRLENDGLNREFYAPNPAETGLRAESVEDLGPAALFGLRISMITIRRLKRHNNWSADKYSAEYEAVAANLGRYLQEVENSGKSPLLILGSKNIETNRLGLLPNQERALYSGPVNLEAGHTYPLNYIGRHWVSPESRARDHFTESVSQEEWFIGYCRDDRFDMGGYAISFKHLINQSRHGLSLGVGQRQPAS